MMEKLKFREKFGFGMGVLGQNLIYGLIVSYLLIYYTDVALIPTAVTGLLFLTARIWDAVNDPFMGIIADRTRTRWGRFRPYMLFTPVFIGIITYLVFSVPDISPGGKVTYIFVTYILWGMIYTVADIPMWSLTSVITKDTAQKTRLIGLITVFSLIGMVGTGVLVVPMLGAFGGVGSARAYKMVALIFSIICTITMIGIFFATKERVLPDNKKISVKDNFKVIFRNKPLLLAICSYVIIMSIMTISQAVMVFFAQYNLNDVGLVPLLTIVMFIPLLAGTAMSGPLSGKFGKKNLFIYSGILRIITYIVFFFTGYGNTVLVLVFVAMIGFLMGMPTVLLTAMLADSVVYAQWKLGIRSDGLVFSMRTFMSKISSAIGGGLAALLLGLYGYVPNAVQSRMALDGIFHMNTLLPAAATFLGLIPFLFYDLTDRKVAEITAELETADAGKSD
ncbi:MAG: MFS transporter [Clostridia bacterium]|nr:MFS transporter [Clostridia bacterium]